MIIAEMAGGGLGGQRNFKLNTHRHTDIQRASYRCFAFSDHPRRLHPRLAPASMAAFVSQIPWGLCLQNLVARFKALHSEYVSSNGFCPAPRGIRQQRASLLAMASALARQLRGFVAFGLPSLDPKM